MSICDKCGGTGFVDEPMPKSKASSEHREVMVWYQEALGYRIPNGPQEGQAVKWMLGNGFTMDDIRGCYEHLKAQHFWANPKHLSLQTVKKEIGAWYLWKIEQKETPVRPVPMFDREGLQQRRAETLEAAKLAGKTLPWEDRNGKNAKL